jgi:hypothetical protein
MIAMFCNENGVTPCGTDSMFHVDGRFCVGRKLQSAMTQRERFRKHFPHKFESFSHVYFVNRVSDSPTKIHKVPVNTAVAAVTG